jgi:hypothetical protein
MADAFAGLKFVIGAFIAGHILFIRPAIVDVFRYAAIIECSSFV